MVKTRKSSCVNARGIPPATYQVHHLLSAVLSWLGYASPPPPHLDLAGVPPRLDLARVPPPPPIWTSLVYSPCLDLARVPSQVWTDKQTETITFPHPPDAGGKNQHITDRQAIRITHKNGNVDGV